MYYVAEYTVLVFTVDPSDCLLLVLHSSTVYTVSEFKPL